MLNIALKTGEKATSITDIARKEGISAAYLEQLLNRLRHKGLIESIRGPRGGYVLSKRPQEITVGDIVKALEGSIYPVRCVTKKRIADNACRLSKDCVPKIVWHKLAKAIEDCLESVTLEDMKAEALRIDRRIL